MFGGLGYGVGVPGIPLQVNTQTGNAEIERHRQTLLEAQIKGRDYEILAQKEMAKEEKRLEHFTSDSQKRIAKFVGHNMVWLCMAFFLVSYTIRATCMLQGVEWAAFTVSNPFMWFFVFFVCYYGNSTVLKAAIVLAMTAITLTDFGTSTNTNRNALWWTVNTLTLFVVMAACVYTMKPELFVGQQSTHDPRIMQALMQQQQRHQNSKIREDWLRRRRRNSFESSGSRTSRSVTN